MDDITRLYENTRDAKTCLAMTDAKLDEKDLSDYSQMRLRELHARLLLVEHIQRSLARLAERAEDTLPHCKRLLARLSLTDEQSIVAALSGCTTNNGTDSDIDDASSILQCVHMDVGPAILDAVIEHLAQLPHRHSEPMTLSKIFPGPKPSSGPGAQYTDDSVREIVRLLQRGAWDEAFAVLARIEPIPPALHVPRMHQPLLRKYLGALLCEFDELQSAGSESRRDMLCQLLRARRLEHKCQFSADACSQLKALLQ